ncbi:LuxR C-terminal-related transcriptional regulator [Serratia entomophila]|uniref:LuxR C-terminal-related transcriptional regulator n=1 Tax=Serratia entomophila TaxID=42906 RepID=UPI00217789F2|nr:LuxR C-terminal-related transcriptional regulator [Serratia entomophila]CAI1160322.1 colanic acid capsular biosynthesis activation protein A [Serratia entomophila]CAI1786095.1 colanic acid capsular biosynthesis activation protein A [Serratia entomophila]CAI1907826.1 colanic acid capsular biosynthesis activation protein A [Serratia entomophila]CAI1913059.1 colanic acid capsular biosynthesis activation protein A [Serratia entomophila]CAI1990977.1 colanic acid capsular biosynthesis activation 
MITHIFSECIYTTIGIRSLIPPPGKRLGVPVGLSGGHICFIDIRIANFEERYRSEYARRGAYKIVIITDCMHRIIAVDNKTIIASNFISLDRFDTLINDLYESYNHNTEPPQLSQRESFFLSEWSTGKSLSDISNIMQIRNKTANHYKAKIMKKFGTSRIKPLLHITHLRHLTAKLSIRINKE